MRKNDDIKSYILLDLENSHWKNGKENKIKYE